MTASPTVEETNAPKRSEDPFAKARHSVGKVIVDYSCYFQGAKGKLYAGTNALYFLGMMFFFAREMNVQWLDVIKVTKTDDCITIQTNDCNFEFTGFSSHDVDRVWATLVSLHSEALHGCSVPRSPLKASTLRRMNSDPTSEMIHSPDGGGPSGAEAAYVAMASVAQLEDVRASRALSTRTLHTIHAQEVDARQDLAEAWAELQESTDEAYSDVAVKDREVSCNLQEFVDMFLADSAKHSIASFMESMEDTDLEVSPWEPDENDTLAQRRTIEYSHPINAPLAPPMARARKEQRYRKYGDHGISIESDTYVQDVPLTDCFYVTDRILVEPVEGTNKVRVMAEFDIRFVKSTMFRAIIANTTRSEFVRWFDCLLEYMSEIVQGMAPEEVAAAARRRKSEMAAVEVPPQPPWLFPPAMTSTHIMMLVLMVVLLLQVWIMFQILAMQRSMLVMQASMMQSCPALLNQDT